MAVARWSDLCLDTGGGDRLGRFWAEVAGLAFEPDGEDGALTGPTAGHRIWLNRVPEPKTAKHRVHLDVYAASIDDLVRLGATVVLPAEESGFGWTVLRDPEGGELCAFLREPAELPAYRVHGLVVDSADAEAAARWWGTAFEVPVHGGPDQGWWWLEDVPGMPISTMDFVPVPEPKTVKNRVHWDVHADAARMLELGATMIRPRDAETSWDVLADPEGNEFCVFAD